MVFWAAVVIASTVPVAVAAFSPLLQWRQPVYIAAGFAGIIGLVVLLYQPLLAGGYMRWLPASRARALHRWLGAGLVITVLIHVGGLWVTSPPDVVDALLFRSPTPFSVWGVTAMWAVFAAAGLAVFRKRLRLPPRVWRRIHTSLAIITVGSTITHALLIEGAMGTMSKVSLCVAVAAATLKTIVDLKIWRSPARNRA
ncbi:ferric reductase like protein [Roseibium hamelinense]|uniref:Ferric reductase like protein n=1 Tax=Roseibium hamelinense TaxID=150831 RepID=A0A562T7U8_9HYPH|nr:ferric reductase-like transmembrane domain-containing protein [Roseibium hamelinense]TWI89612.1 ferric reductase like protein [Roseibium hamelinense]